jgi:hypothetical protein
MGFAGHVARMRENGSPRRILVGKPGQRLSERPERR